MPDQYDPKQTLRSPYGRPAESRPTAAAPKDDPLAELARMVHGRGNHDAHPPRRATEEPPPPADLESELLNDLQASFAAVREAAAHVTARRPEPAPQAAPSRSQSLAPPAPPSVPEPSLPRQMPEPVADQPRIFAPRAQPQPASPPRLEARVEAHPEIRPEFRLEPLDESRLVPIPPAPVIQPQVPPGYAERQAERAAAAAAEPLPRVFERGQRELPPPEPVAEGEVDDFSAFQLRPSTPPIVPPAAQTPSTPSRWEKPHAAEVAPPPVSRFAPPSASSSSADEAFSDEELDPFVEAGLFPAMEAAGDEFDTEDFGLPPDYPDDEEEIFAEPDKAQPMRQRTKAAPPRGMIIAAAVVAIALVGGISVAMFRQGEKSAVAPQTILADDAPTKITPDDSQTAASNDANAQNKIIYDRVNSAEANNNTTLLTPDNAPLRTAPAPDSSNAISRVILPGGPGYDGPSGGQDPGAQTADQTTGAAPGDDDSIGPRKVRTVVVKPDGTILSSTATNAPAGGDAAAGAAPASPAPAPVAVAPVPAPPAPSQQAAAPANAAPLTDDTAAIAGTGGNALTITTNPDDASAPAIPAPSIQNSGVVPATPAPAPAAPQPRPAKAAPAAVASNNNSANAPIDLTPGSASAAPAAVAADGFYVQVSSQRTEDAARATYKDLQTRYPTILGKYDVNLQQASVPARGTFYRVRVGPFSGADAQRLCDDLKSAGGDCVLARR